MDDGITCGRGGHANERETNAPFGSKIRLLVERILMGPRKNLAAVVINEFVNDLTVVNRIFVIFRLFRRG